MGHSLLIPHALMIEILPISKLHSFATVQSFLLRYIRLSRSTGIEMGSHQSSKSKTRMSEEGAFY